jgi:hypothetical protein
VLKVLKDQLVILEFQVQQEQQGVQELLELRVFRVPQVIQDQPVHKVLKVLKDQQVFRVLVDKQEI